MPEYILTKIWVQGRINPRQGPKTSNFSELLDTTIPRDFRAFLSYNLLQ